MMRSKTFLRIFKGKSPTDKKKLKSKATTYCTIKVLNCLIFFLELSHRTSRWIVPLTQVFPGWIGWVDTHLPAKELVYHNILNQWTPPPPPRAYRRGSHITTFTEVWMKVIIKCNIQNLAWPLSAMIFHEITQLTLSVRGNFHAVRRRFEPVTADTTVWPRCPANEPQHLDKTGSTWVYRTKYSGAC